VKVDFLKIGESRNVLLEPSSESSPIQRFLDKHGEGLHHIGLGVDNIHQQIKTVKSEGLRLINEQPKKGAHNADIAFIHPKATGGVLIELCQHDGGCHA